jgi:RimJ/RimL family protein N-acetyltransferase
MVKFMVKGEHMLTGERVALRPVERGDLGFLRDLANDPTVRANVVGWDWPLSLHAQEQWFERGTESDHARRFLIETLDGSPIGLTGLWDIDWRNRTAMSAIKIGGSGDVRGKGYGREALRLMMDFAFRDAGLHRITAQIFAFNQPSLALYLNAEGWVKEGVSRKHVWRDGEYHDIIQLGVLREDYLRGAGAS